MLFFFIYAPDNGSRMCVGNFWPPSEVLFERQLVQPKCHAQLAIFQLGFDNHLLQGRAIVVDIKRGTVGVFDKFRFDITFDTPDSVSEMLDR